jgi:predicted regulator of Ras-like GTPase activity (Roadblock/LC7/MglB family)
MAQSISNGLDPNRLGAMAATALGLGKRINETLSSGEFSEISVAGSRGQMLVYGAGQKAVLAVMSPSGANVGLINFEARNAAEKIIEALQ